MTTDAQITLQHAAELLEANAKMLRQMWRDSPGVRDICDDMQCTALELRILERSIKIDHIPDVGKMVSTVSPATTFEEN